ncbi:MAG: PAS domain S-box protein [Candidatus Methanoperedens sp.]
MNALYEPLHLLAALFAVFVSLSIFAMTWYSYDRSKDNHALFLGAVFLVIGLLDLFHILSYPFMPDFITPNSDEKAEILWSTAHFIMAPLFLLSVFVYKDSFKKSPNKLVLFVLSIALAIIIFILVTYGEYLPVIQNEGTTSPARMAELGVSIAIILYSSYLYKKRIKKTGENNLIFLIYGFIIITLGGVVYISYEVLGHLIEAAGFFCIYLALYKSSVDLPYDKLAIAEEKLRLAAEEKYRGIFDNANDAIITTDIIGHVTSWNKTAEKLFGWTAQEITGKRLVETLSTPETADVKEKMICEILPDTTAGLEIECMRRDGTKIDVSVTISPLLDVNRDIAGKSLIIRDITEHKRDEIALRKSEDFSRTVLNSMNDAIMVIDVRDFSIVGVNKHFQKEYGMKEEDVVGKKCYEITHKIPEPCYFRDELCPLLESVETGKYSTVEHVHFGKNGEKIYVEVSTSPIKDETGKVVKVIHVARDITQRKMAEEAIRESEEKFRLLVEFSPYGIIIHGDRKITFANSQAMKILGATSPGELIGKTIFDIVHPDYHDMVRERILIEETGMIAPLIEEKFLRIDGMPVDVEIIAIPVTIKGKTQMYGVFNDITERKKSEALLRENERLVLANKAKSEFLTVMSHELRTPMNSVIGFSQLLKQKTFGDLNEKQENYLDNIISSGKHLLELINEILDLTKIEAGKMEMLLEKISVPGAVDESLNLMKTNAQQRKITLNKEIDPALDFVEADRKKLNQILLNLVSNAVKFSKDEGGTVTVKVNRIDDSVVFCVSDTGIGIKEEDMSKLFREFQQIDMGTSRKYGGTGLGLAITKRLVELHGGNISAKSRYGEGSTFTFTLPLVAKKGG